MRSCVQRSQHSGGGPGVSRTRDTRFRKPLLYPSELRGHKRLRIAGYLLGYLLPEQPRVLAPHELVADAPRLQQVFWSVFRNACKFTPENGTVSVRSYNPNAKTITIEISDSGVGIEPQFIKRIFDPFEQADSRRQGLGLGLAISKAIVEMHAGTIRARSEGPGKGATFVIDLPVRRSSQ